MADTTPTTPVTPTPTTTSPSFWNYLVDNIPNHLKVLGIALTIGGLVFGINYIIDLRQQVANQAKITATLQQQFQQVGTGAVASNSEQQQSQIQTQANTDFGSAIANAMQQQNAKIQTLTTIIGQVKGTSSPITAAPASQPLAPLVAPVQNQTTGALTGYNMEEVRAGAPPMTSVNLFYNPLAHDPKTAFAGTTWQHYQEVFNASVGQWEAQKTGGLKTTINVTRTISKPDPNDPTKMIVVGTEPISITGANTIYTPSSILGSNPTVLPRWTLNLGLSHDTVNKYQAAGTIDYRVTSHYGVFAGTVNKALVGGVSIRLGGSN